MPTRKNIMMVMFCRRMDHSNISLEYGRECFAVFDQNIAGIIIFINMMTGLLEPSFRITCTAGKKYLPFDERSKYLQGVTLSQIMQEFLKDLYLLCSGITDKATRNQHRGTKRKSDVVSLSIGNFKVVEKKIVDTIKKILCLQLLFSPCNIILLSMKFGSTNSRIILGE